MFLDLADEADVRSDAASAPMRRNRASHDRARLRRGDLAPEPRCRRTGRGPVRAQALADVRATLRNGEQLLLTLVIPLLLLVGLTLFDAVPDTALTAGQSAINVVAPSIIALAVMSTAFTSLAISTGFDRRSGALRLLATTPLTRGQLVLARTIAVLLIEVLQIILIAAVALALGWRPSGEPVAAVLLVLVGTLAFATWGWRWRVAAR